jgi:ubiquitin-conjugating enzyme E2 variant
LFPQVFKPAVWPAAIVLAVSPWLPLFMQAFLPSMTFLCCMSQQFHAWSHMKKSELPGFVVALQDANLLIGRKAHGAHHKPNFEGNYSIVSGWWNPLLDNTGFFRGLEKAIAAATGVEPRCWYPPEHGWEELQQPQRKAS